jgi:orotate phosphoribosyltransferase
MSSRSGHFLFESGHHGSHWLDLEVLCLHPAAVRPFVLELAARLKRYELEAVCGPLIEGAFVALMVASELGLTFTYAERLAQEPGRDLFGYPYRIPNSLRPLLRDRRVAIVNDVIGAGSAVRGTLDDLQRVGARTVALASLMSLGPSASALAERNHLSFETLVSQPFELWTPSECPLCARGEPLLDPAQAL